jgi:hypothetical protein
MKVHQIITERQQLNEFVPVVLGGLGFAGAMSVIGAFITGMSLIEIYRTLSKYNENPDSLSDDDWDNVFMDIALLALPGAARLGKAALVKMLPRSVIRKGSAAVRKKVYEKLAKEKKAADTKYGSAAQAGKTPQQAAKMQQKLNKISTKAKAKAQAELLKMQQEGRIAELNADSVEAQELTKRMQADMGSDSWLSKNIRPMTLIAILGGYFTFAMLSAFEIETNRAYVELLGQWGMLIMSFYFGGRTLEKIIDAKAKKDESK